MNLKLDILAIGVHPDDVELGCSGTLLKHIAQGKKVGILDLTHGELGSRGSGELRLVEAANSAKIVAMSLFASSASSCDKRASTEPYLSASSAPSAPRGSTPTGVGATSVVSKRIPNRALIEFEENIILNG